MRGLRYLPLVCAIACALLTSAWRPLSPNVAFCCAKPRPLATPVTYTLPKSGALKFHGFGLATSGPAIDGVVIAFEAGVSGGGGGTSAPAGGSGSCCANTGTAAANVQIAAAATSAEPRGAIALDFFPIAFVPQQSGGSQCLASMSDHRANRISVSVHFAVAYWKLKDFLDVQFLGQSLLSKAADKIGVDCFRMTRATGSPRRGSRDRALRARCRSRRATRSRDR